MIRLVECVMYDWVLVQAWVLYQISTVFWWCEGGVEGLLLRVCGYGLP